MEARQDLFLLARIGVDVAGAVRGRKIEASIFTALHLGDFRAQMKNRAEGRDLLEQIIGQFLTVQTGTAGMS